MRGVVGWSRRQQIWTIAHNRGTVGDIEELHDENRSLQDYTACVIMRRSADEI
jgi:hypothetical protein